jgi:hypothetical protein
MSDGLVPLIEAQDGKFTGIKFKVKKESEDKMARYIVEKQ